MVTPEERAHERERIAIAAAGRSVVATGDVSWPSAWSGFMVAMAIMIVVTALGVAIGISILDANPVIAQQGRSWSVGAGLWEFFTFIIALFAGGMVSTRTGLFAARPSVSVQATTVWVLSIAAVLVFGAIRFALVTVPLLQLPGTARTFGAPPAIAQAAPDLSTALANGDVDRAVARLADPTTADRIAGAIGLPRDQVMASLADIRGRLEANRADPSAAVAAARTGLQNLVASVPNANRLASAVPEPMPQPAATIAGWVTFFVLVASLAAAIGGAAAGVRPAATR